MTSANSPRWVTLLKLIQQLTRTAYNTARQQMNTLLAMWRSPRSGMLEWNPAQAQRVEERVRRSIAEQDANRPIQKKADPNKGKPLVKEEREIVRHIERSVRNMNRSNITRTHAYASIYQAYPELHWAMLAHMVSRNGGWNMTDLQGNVLPAIMDSERRLWMYRTLERCNALIFQDAYPQLLLYAASRRLGRSLFHLLPIFHVSSFMSPFWESFWIQPNSPLLTTALIINEQHVIEGRVVRSEEYVKHVIGRTDFSLHGIVQMNQVVFPVGTPNIAAPMPLYGLTLEKFDSIKERISFGKQLYTLLFDVPEVNAGAHRFMQTVPHTASRSDYWPHRFTSRRPSTSNSRHEQKVNHDLLIYSPKLNDAWKDDRHAPIEPGDWLRRDDVLQELFLPPTPAARAAYMSDLHELMWDELIDIAQLAQE
ncbi:DUF2515 family protein [Paenibacillus marinisediminis]